MRVGCVAIIALMLSASAASALTRAELRACFGDAVRLCGAISIDPPFLERLRIQFCMLGHRSEVSPACRAVFVAHGL